MAQNAVGRTKRTRRPSASLTPSATKSTDGWPTIIEKFDLAEGRSPFASSRLVHAIAHGGVPFPALSELPTGRTWRAWREAVGLSLDTVVGIWSFGRGHYAALERSERPLRLSEEAFESSVADGLRGFLRLMSAVADYLAYRESTGQPLDVVIAPTEEELAKAEAARLAEARASDPFFDLREAATAANGPDARSDDFAAFRRLATPAVVLDLLERAEM